MFTLEFSAESVGAYGIFLLENELRKYCDCSIRSKGGGWRWAMADDGRGLQAKGSENWRWKHLILG